jgi:hypothetical protein
MESGDSKQIHPNVNCIYVDTKLDNGNIKHENGDVICI